MVCVECGCEKLLTVKVYRNTIRRDRKWLSSAKADTRLVVCDECGGRYYVESTLNQRIIFEKDRKIERNISLPLFNKEEDNQC